MKAWKKIFHTCGNQKRTRIAILISEKTEFKSKTTGDKGHDLMIKETYEEDITIINICVPYIGAPKYMKQIQQI